MGYLFKFCGEPDFEALLSEKLIIFDTSGDQCGYEGCDDYAAPRFESTTLLNKAVSDPIFARQSDDCHLIFSKNEITFFNTVPGADLSTLEIEIERITEDQEFDYENSLVTN